MTAPKEVEENGDVGARVREPPPFGEGVPGRGGARDQSSNILFVRGVFGVPPTWLGAGREASPRG